MPSKWRLSGYTNAGKSTLFNRLTEAASFEENQLFATLDPMTKKCILPSGFTVLITDTVGFIQDLTNQFNCSISFNAGRSKGS